MNVLEQALEALEASEKYLPAGHEHAAVVVAIAALKVAIKQQGEPVVWYADCIDGLGNKSRQYYNNPGELGLRHPLYTSAPTIPEGMRLVPKEPTEAMLEAGYFTDHAANRGVYKAMLSAAPEYKGGK
jgi:hypothetical protein